MNDVLNSHLQQWLDSLDQQAKSPHTIAAYRRGISHFIAWLETLYDAPFDPEKVIPRDIRDWKQYQQITENAAPATVNQRLVALSRFYDWLVAQKRLTGSPTTDINGVRVPNRQPKSLSERDLRRLLREARTHSRDYAILEFMVGTGLRVGELLTLQIGDITLNERSGKVVIRYGKGGNYREVPLTYDVRKALGVYLAEHPKTNDPGAPLWLRGSRALLHRSSILRLLRKYARLANIDPVHSHQLRHTFATRYLRANPGDLRGLARLLGHSNINSVMIYTEPHLDDLAARMERADSYIPPD